MGTGKINNVEKYLEGQWAWRPLMDDLFCNPKIVPMDLDGLIEHKGHLLFIERKHEMVFDVLLGRFEEDQDEGEGQEGKKLLEE